MLMHAYLLLKKQQQALIYEKRKKSDPKNCIQIFAKKTLTNTTNVGGDRHIAEYQSL